MERYIVIYELFTLHSMVLLCNIFIIIQLEVIYFPLWFLLWPMHAILFHYLSFLLEILFNRGNVCLDLCIYLLFNLVISCFVYYPFEISFFLIEVHPFKSSFMMDVLVTTPFLIFKCLFFTFAHRLFWVDKCLLSKT